MTWTASTDLNALEIHLRKFINCNERTANLINFIMRIDIVQSEGKNCESLGGKKLMSFVVLEIQI